MNDLIGFTRTWLALKADRRGVTMLEYGLIAALIAVVCIAAVGSLGTSLSSMFGTLATKVSSATNG